MIRDVGFILLRHTLTRRYGDAQGLKTHRTTLLVRIGTADGATGWGEISNVRNDANLSHLRELRDLLVGQDPCNAAPLVQRAVLAGPRVAAGIDVALADLRGRLAGMSLATLLGGAFRSAQPAYASLQNAGDEPDIAAAAVRDAGVALRLGFRHIKMKVGWHAPEVDAAWIERVLDTLPDGMLLAIDANRVLSAADAIRLVRLVRRPERLSWFEEPCSNRHPDAYHELRERLPLPIAGGESMPVAALRDVIAGRKMDIVQPDLVTHGGFRPMLDLFALCDAFGVRLIPHCFDGTLTRVATLHLLASRPDWEERHGEYEAAPLEVDISDNPLRDELLREPLRPDAAGCMAVPEGPGLGVQVDEAFVARVGQRVEL